MRSRPSRSVASRLAAWYYCARFSHAPSLPMAGPSATALVSHPWA